MFVTLRRENENIKKMTIEHGGEPSKSEIPVSHVLRHVDTVYIYCILVFESVCCNTANCLHLGCHETHGEFECVLELNQQKPQIICFEYVKLTLNEDFLLLFLLPFTLSTILARIVQHILKNSDLRME